MSFRSPLGAQRLSKGSHEAPIDLELRAVADVDKVDLGRSAGHRRCQRVVLSDALLVRQPIGAVAYLGEGLEHGPLAVGEIRVGVGMYAGDDPRNGHARIGGHYGCIAEDHESRFAGESRRGVRRVSVEPPVLCPGGFPDDEEVSLLLHTAHLSGIEAVFPRGVEAVVDS